jgi:hypothetical protein
MFKWLKRAYQSFVERELLHANLDIEPQRQEIFDQQPPEFLRWAFGEHHARLMSIEKMEVWNELHGHLHIFSGDDKIVPSLQIMQSYWRQEKKI